MAKLKESPSGVILKKITLNSTKIVKTLPTVENESTIKKRYRPGSKALQEIRQYQRGTGFLIPSASFQRLVRQLTADISQHPLRFTEDAFDCIQTASEAFLIQLFEDSVLAMINAKRVTLMASDMQLIRRIRGF